MLSPVLITPPSASVVSTAELRAHLRIDDADQDTLIGSLRDAAVANLDGWTGILGRCLAEQVWRQDYDGFARCLRLPLAPVLAVSGDDPLGVTYLDTAGDSQTIDSTNYQLLADAAGYFVRFNDAYAFPAVYSEPPAVSITFKAGYSSSAVPAAIKVAILMMVAHWFENREAVAVGVSVAEMPLAADRLLAPYRRIGV